MAQPEQPKFAVTERLDGAKLPEPLPQTCRRHRSGSMVNIARPSDAAVFFWSRWTQEELRGESMVQQFKSLPRTRFEATLNLDF